MAIGAGAHGKVTHWQDTGLVVSRFNKSRTPKDYMAVTPAPHHQWFAVTAADLPFEFMLNALRLVEGVPTELFSSRTGLSLTK